MKGPDIIVKHNTMYILSAFHIEEPRIDMLAKHQRKIAVNLATCENIALVRPEMLTSTTRFL